MLYNCTEMESGAKAPRIAIIIAVFVIGFFLFVQVTRSLFGGEEGEPTRTTTSDQQELKPLVDYAKTNSSVVFTTAGPIVGENYYREIRVTVNDSKREIEIIHGYNDRVAKRKNFPNTRSAYRNLLAALQREGFDLRREKAPDYDETGACSFRERYIYEIIENGNEVMRNWNDACSKTSGSSAAIINGVSSLFEAQIPNYNNITYSVGF